MDNNFKTKNGSGHLCCKGCGRQDRQLNTYDWLADIPGNAEEQEIVEVQFKNTRKGFYKNSNKLKLAKGDIVAILVKSFSSILELNFYYLLFFCIAWNVS